MTAHKVRLITGAGRGMGVDFAKAALAHGYDDETWNSRPPEPGW
jgi:NAD(P)-dependent dehydrogenase (short-subunit alcohol dehydrogenase family)